MIGIALVRQKVIPFSLALVDNYIPGLKGPRVIVKLREHDLKIHLLGFLGDDGIDPHNESLDSRALMFVAKNIENEKLLGIVHRVCREFGKKNRLVIEALGLRLRQIRERKGWTLEQTEEHGWVSWRHLQRIESGKNVTLITLYRVAKLYGVTV